MTALLYSIIKAVPAARDIFFGLQDLYYNETFERLSTIKNDYKGKRRALSNAIELSKTDDDRRQYSLMLAELQSASRDR